jgi:hypothetical protein
MSFKLLAATSLALVLSLLFFVPVASAHPVPSSSPPFTLQLHAGLGATTREGYWLPVQVTVRNNSGTNFTGTLSLRTFSGLFHPTDPGIASEQRFEEPVAVARGSQKQVSLYVAFNVGPFNPRGVLAELLDNHDRVLASQTQRIYTLNPGDISVGVLSDQSSSFGALSSVSLPNRANIVAITTLDASSMPDMSVVLENFEVMVLDDFSTSSLSPAQLTALQTWVNQGGVLIEVGGPQWQRTLGDLPPDLLPVILYDTTDLPSGMNLLPTGSITPSSGQQTTLQVPLTVSTSSLRLPGDAGRGSVSTGEVALSYGTTPLIVQAHQGEGAICYLAFDPASYPLAGWAGTSVIWEHLLMRTLGDQLLVSNLAPRYASGPGGLLARGGILTPLQPDLWFAAWILVVLLCCYVILLGPVRLLIVRRRHRPYWNWRIAVSSILIFSALSYGIAFYQKGSSLIDNSISIVQVNQSGSGAHITTYMGVFVPSQGNFQVQFPGSDLAQAIPTPLLSSDSLISYGDPTTPVTYGPDRTNVNLLNTGIWTFHPLVSEQDRQLHGGLTTHLSLRGKQLVGTITNTFSTALSDVYILIPHSFVAIGHLAAGATMQINQPLQSVASSSATTLADQIAISNGLPANYYPYGQQSGPRTTLQRHIALLEALSGAGFSFPPCDGPCGTHAITNIGKSTIVALSPGMPTITLDSSSDPLLLNGSPATLIGWADQPLDGTQGITVNGRTPRGFHDNFIQMPLDINLSSPLNTPANFIEGQVLDALGTQGNDIEMVLPGIYTMSTGSMSFEFNLPDNAALQANGLEITVPNTLDHPVPRIDSSYVHASLYDWLTDTWDPFTLGRYTLTTSDMDSYISPDGRVLLQLTNQNIMQGPIFLSKPSLTLTQ